MTVYHVKTSAMTHAANLQRIEEAITIRNRLAIEGKAPRIIREHTTAGTIEALGGCCDACGETGTCAPDNVLCVVCKEIKCYAYLELTDKGTACCYACIDCGSKMNLGPAVDARTQKDFDSLTYWHGQDCTPKTCNKCNGKID